MDLFKTSAFLGSFFLAFATPSQADVTYSGKVNGFGWGKIDYKITCADGTVLSGTSDTSPGTRACPDGSNSIDWSWGAFWSWNVDMVENKSLNASYQSVVSGDWVGPDTISLQGGIQRSGPGFTTELALLMVPMELLPEEPLSVMQLLEAGMIFPDEILFLHAQAPDQLQAPINELIQLPPGVSEDMLTLYEFTTTNSLVATNYCQATVNSTGAPGHISAFGSSSISANNLILEATSVPEQFGVFFHGPQQTQIPFGNGFRCIAGSIVRLDVVYAFGGEATMPLDLPLLGLPPGPVNFQYWYRDPVAGGAQFNLTEGLEVMLMP